MLFRVPRETDKQHQHWNLRGGYKLFDTQSFVHSLYSLIVFTLHISKNASKIYPTAYNYCFCHTGK